MSTDNRILIGQHTDGKWYVWEGSCSFDYYEIPIEYAKCFETEDEATRYAIQEADKCCVLEGGIQTLTKDEIIRGLKDEVRHLSDELKHPTYCPTCGACGENGCCPPSQCKHGFCLHGDKYALDFEYYKMMVNELYNFAKKVDKDALDAIFNKCHDAIYKTKEIKNESTNTNTTGI